MHLFRLIIFEGTYLVRLKWGPKSFERATSEQYKVSGLTPGTAWSQPIRLHSLIFGPCLSVLFVRQSFNRWWSASQTKITSVSSTFQLDPLCGAYNKNITVSWSLRIIKAYTAKKTAILQNFKKNSEIYKKRYIFTGNLIFYSTFLNPSWQIFFNNIFLQFTFEKK